MQAGYAIKATEAHLNEEHIARRSANAQSTSQAVEVIRFINMLSRFVNVKSAMKPVEDNLS